MRVHACFDLKTTVDLILRTEKRRSFDVLLFVSFVDYLEPERLVKS
jgi:hypothetical protein